MGGLRDNRYCNQLVLKLNQTLRNKKLSNNMFAQYLDDLGKTKQK